MTYTKADGTTGDVNQSTKLFNAAALYEPGYTEYVKLTIKNAGTLALKYQLGIYAHSETKGVNVAGDEFALSDYIKVGATESAVADRATAVACANSNVSAATALNEGYLEKGETKDVYLVVTMPTSVGNEANHNGNKVPSITFGVNLVATQYTFEKDSFDNQYDLNAQMPTVVTNATDLEAAVAEGKDVKLENGVNADVEISKDAVVNIDLNKNGLTSTTEAPAITNEGEVAITGGGTITATGADTPVLHNTGKATLSGVTVESKGATAYGINTDSSEAVTILNDVTFNGERGALRAVNGAKVIFNSGKVTVDGTGNSVGHVVYAYGAGTEVTINDGEFVHNRNCTKGAMIYAHDGAKVIVNGGSFTKGPNGYKDKWIQAVNAEVIIKGGTFQFDPSEFVADGYTAVAGTDGWWTVKPAG